MGIASVLDQMVKLQYHIEIVQQSIWPLNKRVQVDEVPVTRKREENRGRWEKVRESQRWEDGKG